MLFAPYDWRLLPDYNFIWPIILIYLLSFILLDEIIYLETTLFGNSKIPL